MSVKLNLIDCLESFCYLLMATSRPTKFIFFAQALENKFTSTAVYGGINKLYKKGHINKIRQGRNFFVQLLRKPDFSADGLARLKTSQSKGTWDGQWRLLIYDIPEKKRAARNDLRIFISSLGFGKIQGSCWVSPYDLSPQIHAFCKEKNILKYICLYEGKFFAGKNIDELVQEVWNLSGIAAAYADIIARCKEGTEQIKKSKSPPECFNIYFEVYSALLNVLRNDPHLPKEFLKNSPKDAAEKAFQDFAQYASALLIPASPTQAKYF